LLLQSKANRLGPKDFLTDQPIYP